MVSALPSTQTVAVQVSVPLFFGLDYHAVVEPLGGIIEGWGVKQEVRGLPM